MSVAVHLVCFASVSTSEKQGYNSTCFIRVLEEQMFVGHYVPGPGERVGNKMKSVWGQIRCFVKTLSTRLTAQHTLGVFPVFAAVSSFIYQIVVQIVLSVYQTIG